VQVHVRQHAAAQPVAHRHDRPGLRRRDAVDRAAQPWLKGDPLVGLQHERIQEQHAELPVRDPRLAFAQALERADVDEDRRCALPLDVVGRAVLEHQRRGQAALEHVELQQRRVAQHPERPLVGVGDERDRGVAQHARPAVANRRLAHHLVRLDDGAALGQLVEDRRRAQRVPVLEASGAERAEHGPVGLKDPAVGIAE
jgi:hypothetical protein